ncbi:MAG: ATP-dependent helicase HrpB [Planctomycetota bacterium]
MLPVLEIENQITACLESSNRLVLAAPTGSGKTTQVPQILDRMSGLEGQIVVLQPRRLATRMVAQRVAEEMGVEVGGRVGYQTRYEKKIGRDTRIRFMTEGLLLRRLGTDPTLVEVGAVVLDEFHERNLAADLMIGFVKRLQDSGRPDLKLLVMSATIDTQKISDYLGCDTLEVSGRQHPVRVAYSPRMSQSPIWDQAAEALTQSIEDGSTGSTLIFMPGVYEINRTIAACQNALKRMREDAEVAPLHGSLKPQQQDSAVRPASKGRRKIIVATNVAETSITIDGVGCVIDSGLARQNRYDDRRGLNVLKIEPITRASAEQRRGRAGRTGPGVCYRLWTSTDHARRADFDEPEVRRVELAETVLTLLAMGGRTHDFDWLDAPKAEAIELGVHLLRELGAMDEIGGLTDLGQRMAAYPMHPRLSRMLIEAETRGCLNRALVWVALIAERDIALRDSAPKLRRFVDPAEADSDLAVLAHALEAAHRARFAPDTCASLGVNGAACRDVDRAARQFAALSQSGRSPAGTGAHVTKTHVELIKCLLVAYPDHVANLNDVKRRICVLPGRRRVALDRGSMVEQEGVIVAVGMSEVGRGDSSQTVLSLVNRVEPDWLEEIWPERVRVSREVRWCEQTQAVRVFEQRGFYPDPEDDLMSVVLNQKECGLADPAEAEPELVRRIMGGDLALSKWDGSVEQWIQRVRLVAEWFPGRGLLRYTDEDIELLLHDIVAGEARFNRVKDRPCLDVVRNALEWGDQQFVERMAPTTIQLPSGYRMKIEYRPDAPPIGRAKVQQLYDLDETPRIASGRVEILLEILGPNFRPVQTTGDLASFWKVLYPELKKELKRRYPKHEWR